MGEEKQMRLSFSDERLPAWFAAYLVSLNRKELTLILKENEVEIEDVQSDIRTAYVAGEDTTIAFLCPVQGEGHSLTGLFQIDGKDVLQFPESWGFLQKEIEKLDICMSVLLPIEAKIKAAESVFVCYKETITLIPELLSLEQPYVRMFKWEDSYSFVMGGCFRIQEFLMGLTLRWETGQITGCLYAVEEFPSVMQFLQWVAGELFKELSLDWLEQEKKIFDASIQSASLTLDVNTGEVIDYMAKFQTVLFGIKASVCYQGGNRLISAGMEEGEKITVKGLLSGLPNGLDWLPAEMEDLTVSQCSIEIALEKKSLRFQCRIEEICTIAGFELEEASLLVETGQSASFQVSGIALVGDAVRMRLTIDYRGRDAWVFLGRVELVKPLSLPQVPFLASLLPEKAEGKLGILEATYENETLVKAVVEVSMERPKIEKSQLEPSYRLENTEEGLIVAEEAVVPENGPVRAEDGIRWHNIYKQIGLVALERIGVAFDDMGVYAAIEAGISLGPVSVEALGLMAGYDLTKKAVSARLNGLSISCKTNAFALSGAIYKDMDPSSGSLFSYSGVLALKLAKWELGAAASYVEREDGSKCLFVFLSCRMSLAVTPVFLITGMMGGLGIHWNLKIPAAEEMDAFPLLEMDGVAEQGKVLSELKQWLTPAPGDYWAALGIKFQICGLFRGKALLVLLFGTEFQAALCGTAELTLPGEASKEDAYAYIKILIAAVLRPEAGIFYAKAALSKDSFLLSRDCHLVGEAVCSLWFGPHENAGDFVFSVGGYHPQFRIPDHYPKPNAVGFSWQVCSSVSAKGSAYMAITPSCIMAGGNLEFLYCSGAIKAWFTAYANFLMNWRPFYFRAAIGVEVGVSCRLNLLFCHKTIKVVIGASLDLWGPPIGGKIKVKLCFITFHISFGKGECERHDCLDWKEFRKTLLPEKKLHRIETVSGVRTQGEESESWICESGRFSLLCTTSVPVGNISIRPMGLSGVDSCWQIRVAGPDGEEREPAEYGMEWKEETENLPEALWGEGTRAVLEAKMIKGKTKGVLSVAPPLFSGELEIADYREALIESLKLSNPIMEEKEAEPVMEHGIETTESVTMIGQISDKSKAERRARLRNYLQNYYKQAAGDFFQTGKKSMQLYKDFPRLRR